MLIARRACKRFARRRCTVITWSHLPRCCWRWPRCAVTTLPVRASCWESCTGAFQTTNCTRGRWTASIKELVDGAGGSANALRTEGQILFVFLPKIQEIMSSIPLPVKSVHSRFKFSLWTVLGVIALFVFITSEAFLIADYPMYHGY